MLVEKADYPHGPVFQGLSAEESFQGFAVKNGASKNIGRMHTGELPAACQAWRPSATAVSIRMALKPLTKVYKAYFKAGMEKEAGTVKEAFLRQLYANGVDVERATIYRLARVLRGELRMVDLFLLYPVRQNGGTLREPIGNPALPA